jgi:phage shock protein A
MTQEKPPPHDPAEAERITLEIQRTGVTILTVHRQLTELEQKIADLRKRREELRAGQRLFKLDEEKTQ